MPALSSNEIVLRETKTRSKCFKNYTYKNYNYAQGVCVSEADYNKCKSHEDCQERGGKCCSDYCCNEKYYNSLSEVVRV